MRLVPRGMGATLFLAFSIAALPALVAAGFLLEWQAREALEAELTRRVESLAVGASAWIHPSTWPLILELKAGDEESRTARYVRSSLERIRSEGEVERIALWTADGRLIVDTSLALPIGVAAPRATLLRRELEIVRSGRTASTPLFRTSSGKLMKIGLAPVPGERGGDAPTGVLLVEAPSSSLEAIAAMRRTLVVAGAVGWLFVLAVALWLSRRLTARVTQLAGAARRIARGDLESPVPALGEDQIGLLAGALDRMRDAVRVRERHLRSMVGGVAHEIRNPLGGLILNAEMLSRDTDLPPKQRAKADRILAEALRLERVVSEFLTYARPERPQEARIDLAAALEESAESARGGLGWGGELVVAADRLRVHCDEDHLRQVLLNLLRNAMQACGGEGTVRARVSREGSDVELSVEDSGSGIPEGDRLKVFEPFYSGKPEGAGLGLAIAKRLCDLGGIAIRVDDSELGGARFRLTFRHHPGE